MARMPVEVRRTALIEAALRVAASRGLHETTTRAIVAEAGMTLASFHYAFESRDELIDRLILDVLAGEEKTVLPDELEGRTLTELLTDGLHGYIEHLRADPAREQAMLELTQYALRTRLPMAKNSTRNTPASRRCRSPSPRSTRVRAGSYRCPPSRSCWLRSPMG